MAYIIFCAISMEIDSSQPGIQLNNEDRAQHQFNYSSRVLAKIESQKLIRPLLWGGTWHEEYGKPFGFLFSISRYREIIFRYREIINFPISGNDFRISGIDFPISGKSIPDIRKYRYPTRVKQVTPPPCNAAPYQQRPPAIPAPSETVITTK